ncbi:MAG: RpiB/LacA/LacB family sugar-phosphate isomerase [Bacteroidales bacterium]|jgi:ribose 5-phosphate isomerase B|nr:RpiB/LacA/LacB family sugar-phosphate isomerase [Bacteroidales bacterium]
MTLLTKEKKMTVAIGCDPNASSLKVIIIDQLEKMGYSVNDFGSEDPIYAKVAIDVGEAVAENKFDRGILLCGTGIGMCIAANKVPGVFAALCADTYSAERSIKSNNANVLAIGAFTTGTEVAKQIVKTWMESTWQTGTTSEPKVAYFVEYAKKHQI